jgi:tetratricopeptide (TPR) repeat protein
LDVTRSSLSYLADLVANGHLTFVEAAARWSAASGESMPLAGGGNGSLVEGVSEALRRSPAEGLAGAALAAVVAADGGVAPDTLLSELAGILLPVGADRHRREALATLLETPGTAPPGLALALWERLASCALTSGEARLSVQYAGAGRELAVATDEPRAGASCWLVEGEAHTALGDTEASVASYREAMRLAEIAGWTVGQWRAVSAMAVSLAEEGAPEVEHWCRESLRLASQAGCRGEPATVDCMCVLGRLLQERGECEEAVAVLQAAVQRARSLRDRRRVAEGVLCMGWACLRSGAHQEAVDAFWEALELAEARGDETGRSGASSGLAAARARTEALPATRFPLLAMFREMLNDPTTVSIFDRGRFYPGVAADLRQREVRERVTRRTLCWLRSQYEQQPYEEYDLSSEEAELLLCRALRAIKIAMRDRVDKRGEMLRKFRLHLDREGKLSVQRVREATDAGSAEERRLWELVYPALHERTIERAILFWLIDHGVRFYPDKPRGMLS